VHPAQRRFVWINVLGGAAVLASYAHGIGVLGALLALEPKGRRLAYGFALAGCVFFCIQTAFLDALVWPAFFPFP
jgi:hypothetical protein